MTQTTNHADIRIGTLTPGAQGAEYIRQILPHGFESFSINFWQTIGDANLPQLAEQVKEVLQDSDAIVSTLSVYGNPLDSRPIDEETRKSWEQLIDAAELFDTKLITGFAGRLIDKPIDESIPRFKEVFEPLVQRAADKGVRIAFENCDMGGNWRQGDWNIAHNPTAWEMMFDAIPADNLGLEWEPCHQMVHLIDPIPQLRKWVDKVFHVHGKDATVCRDIINEYGIGGPKKFVYHRTPGFGDSNWTDIISILRQAGYTGCIDIEGWHDPVYHSELEMTGQVYAMNYLKQCRGGKFIINPKTEK